MRVTTAATDWLSGHFRHVEMGAGTADQLGPGDRLAEADQEGE